MEIRLAGHGRGTHRRYHRSHMLDVIRKPFVIPAVVCVAVIVVVLVLDFDPIVNGHPSYLVFYLGFLLISVLALAWAVWKRDSRGRLWLSVPGGVALILVAVGAWLIAPFAATDVALDAMVSTPDVAVTSSASSITLEPQGSVSGVGLVFQPGARVDARAYAHILRPLAEEGHRVVIVKQPLGVAFFASGFAGSWADQNPETEWAVGGHSLGGVVASLNVADDGDLDRLVLWASFPPSDISDTAGLDVVSVYGTNDGLSTPDDVRASATDLPEETAFVPVEGAVHSHFGDYGEQPGDGEPGTSRTEAQEDIVAATLAFLAG